MGSLCDAIFVGNAHILTGLVPTNKKYYVVTDLGARQTQDALAPLNPRVLKPDPLFAEPEFFCQSFSKYFRAVTESKRT
jgi:hypothetical protein